MQIETVARSTLFGLLLAPALWGQDTQAAVEPPAIEPRALEVFQAMAEHLAQAPTFGFVVEETYDDLSDSGQRIQLSNTRAFAVRRPDRVIGQVHGDVADRSVWYDGRKVTILDERNNVWASLEVPDSIDEALDFLVERTGIVMPVSDLLYSDLERTLLANTVIGDYLGLHYVRGRQCHHLAFQQEWIDWQLWIDATGDPLPRRFTITYKTEDGMPQYTATIERWKLGLTLSDEMFEFEPPAGATRMEFEAIEPAVPTHGGGE